MHEMASPGRHRRRPGEPRRRRWEVSYAHEHPGWLLAVVLIAMSVLGGLRLESTPLMLLVTGIGGALLVSALAFRVVLEDEWGTGERVAVTPRAWCLLRAWQLFLPAVMVVASVAWLADRV